MVFLGNLFLHRSCEACFVVFLHGGDFSIENPEFSLIWQTPAIHQLMELARAWFIDFDQCAFGAPSVKPTRLLVSHESFVALRLRCPRNHTHVQLKGKVWSDFFGRWVFRTKLAQVYPDRLCQAMAKVIQQLWPDDAAQFSSSFLITASSRKRPLGQPLRWRLHRQAVTALKAEAAGCQLKRGARSVFLIHCAPKLIWIQISQLASRCSQLTYRVS